MDFMGLKFEKKEKCLLSFPLQKTTFLQYMPSLRKYTNRNDLPGQIIWDKLILIYKFVE